MSNFQTVNEKLPFCRVGRGVYVIFFTDLAVNDGHYMCGRTLATSFSGPFCGYSDGDGTTSFFKHLIFFSFCTAALS